LFRCCAFASFSQLPDKTIASLVKYYYSWKKTRLKMSYIDKCMEKSQAKIAGEPGTNSGTGILTTGGGVLLPQEQQYPQEVRN
jgi:hypothetical protein